MGNNNKKIGTGLLKAAFQFIYEGLGFIFILGLGMSGKNYYDIICSIMLLILTVFGIIRGKYGLNGVFSNVYTYTKHSFYVLAWLMIVYELIVFKYGK